MKKPEIGTLMYSVHEHLYYIKDRTAPVLEYCICEAEVTGFFKGGYTEICLVGPNPDGFQTPYKYKLSEIGRKLFFTARDAAALAKQMTETYERTWGWINDPPMRRTWEKYLCESEKGME